MSEQPPYQLAAQLSRLAYGLAAELLSSDISAAEKLLLKQFKSETNDVRLDIRDYEFADTHKEQVAAARRVQRRVVQVRQTVIALSTYNIFTPIDVAQVSAQLEYLSEQVQ